MCIDLASTKALHVYEQLIAAGHPVELAERVAKSVEYRTRKKLRRLAAERDLDQWSRATHMPRSWSRAQRG